MVQAPLPALAGRPFLVAGALSGLLSAALGVAGGLLEAALTGPWPDAADPGYADYLVANRAPILAQSMLFVFSSAALLWFLGHVRARLLRAEPEPGTVSGIAFAAGVLAVGLEHSGPGRPDHSDAALTGPDPSGASPPQWRVCASSY